MVNQEKPPELSPASPPPPPAPPGSQLEAGGGGSRGLLLFELRTQGTGCRGTSGSHLQGQQDPALPPETSHGIQAL